MCISRNQAETELGCVTHVHVHAGELVEEIAPTCRVSGLDHKLFNNSVEDVSIVIAIACMNAKVLYCLGTAVKNGQVLCFRRMRVH